LGENLAGMIKKKPLLSLYRLEFVNAMLLSGRMIFEVSRKSDLRWLFDFSLRYYVFMISSFIFIYLFLNNNRYAWHIAFFTEALGIPLLLIYDNVSDDRSPYTTAVGEYGMIIFWVLCTGYLLWNYRAYMDFTKDLTNKHYCHY
jgi:hypothetical protein